MLVEPAEGPVGLSYEVQHCRYSLLPGLNKMSSPWSLTAATGKLTCARVSASTKF